MFPLLTHNLLHLTLTLAGLAGLLALLHLTERATARFVAHRLGWNALLVTAWLGVPVHELSHLLMARFFGHRIIAYRLFAPDPVSGTLGFVRHGYSKRSAWQVLGGLFIGIAPLLLGTSLMLALLAWMITPAHLLTLGRDLFGTGAAGLAPASHGFGAVGALVGLIWEQRTPWLPLQLYLAVCLASHMSPGIADLKGARPGAALAVITMALAAGVAAHLGVQLTALPTLLAPVVLVALVSALFQGLYVAGIWGVLRLVGGSGRTGGRRARGPRRCRA